MNDYKPPSEGLDSYLRELTSPVHIRRILKDAGIRVKKSFGQNFLINRDIVRRVIDYAEIDGSNTVLEIGPGLGTLTFELAGLAKKVVAVEIDRGLCRYLNERIRAFGLTNIELVHNDFLKMNTSDFSDGTIDRMVSNLPYSIGIKALLKVTGEMESIQRISVTIQREMALRLTAKPGMKEYAYTSVAVQSAADIFFAEKGIAPENFFPRPEVESSVVVLDLKKKTPVRGDEFLRIARAGFANRRKSLVNNLSRLKMGISKEQLKEIIKRLFSDVHIRAEQLSIEDFKRLTAYLTSAEESK